MNEQNLKEEEERYMDIMNDCANKPTNQTIQIKRGMHSIYYAMFVYIPRS